MDKKLEKIIDLTLDNSERTAERHGLIQYNYGQILRIHGLDLPPAVEIQFSYREKGGVTENRVGTTKDGITEVQIPDKMLKNNGTTQDYAIWVYIYVTDETSGNTIYRIKLYVDSRPAPGETGEDPDEPHILDEAVNAVNAAAERAETAKMEARSAADSAATSAESAKKSAEEVVQEKNTAISAIQNQQVAAEKAITDHTDTEIARQIAATKEATDALTGQINKAGTAESLLKEATEDAGKRKAELETSIKEADAAKGRVDNSTELAETAKKNLDKSVQSASDQKSALDESTENAVKVKEELENATNNIHDGKSAYEYAQDGGYTGTEEEFAEKLATEYLTDVQVNGGSIVQDGVANIPPAYYTTKGVIYIAGTNNGLCFVNGNGLLAIQAAPKSRIDSRTYTQPIVPTNLDYAVKVAMCDGKGDPWTADEQVAARERIGSKKTKLIFNTTIEEDVTQFEVPFAEYGDYVVYVYLQNNAVHQAEVGICWGLCMLNEVNKNNPIATTSKYIFRDSSARYTWAFEVHIDENVVICHNSYSVTWNSYNAQSVSRFNENTFGNLEKLIFALSTAGERDVYLAGTIVNIYKVV